jgi:CHAT domain-containing protein
MITLGPIKLLSRPVRLWLLILCTAAQPAFCQLRSDPKQLQQDGIATIERWRGYVSRTGNAKGTVSDLTTAYKELQASVDLFVERNDFADAAWSAIKMGDILRYNNLWSDGLALYQKAIEWAKLAKRLDYQTKALSHLAYSEMQSGGIDAARGHARDAMRLGETCGNRGFYFEALDVAGEIEVTSGDLVAAGEYLDKALAMSGEIQDKQQLYGAYSDRGDIYVKIAQKCDYQHNFDVCYKSLELSRANYQKALAITEELGYNFFSQMFQVELNDLEGRKAVIRGAQEGYGSNAYANLFNPQMPKDVYVTERFTGGAANPGTLTLLENAVKELQDWQERMRLQGLIVQDLDPLDLTIQGQLAQFRGNYDEALAKYMQSVALLEKDRRKLRDEQARGTFLENKVNDYYLPAKILLERKQYPQAFALFERARSRAMADLIASRALGLGSPRERVLFSELQTQRATIAAKQEKLFNLVSSESRDQHTKEIMGLENEIAGLQRQYQELEVRIAQEAPKLKELTSAEPVTLESVQRAAAAGGYDVLYYVVTETAVILWHINGTEVQVKNVSLPHNQLIAKTAALQSNLGAAKTAPAVKFDDSMSRQLFLFLIQPALTYIKSQHIIIVPQEELASIPFQSLLDPATGKFLGETYALSYAPSATVLATLDQRSNLKNGRLLAVADPAIADASAEVEAIGKFYPGRSKVVSKDPLSKAEVGSLMSDYNAVHLSVHGKFNASDPLLSYLEFKPSPPADGHLTAAEMFGLPLQKNSLIVLSACETGKVQETHASEALGMVRSLLYAGASTLVLSAWEVNATSTKLWMETFYREGQSKSPAEAARLALIAVKSRPEYSHPFYWAPFVMTGK